MRHLGRESTSFIALWLMVFGPSESAAQCGESFDWSVAPLLAGGVVDGDRTLRPGVRGSVDTCRIRHDLSTSFSRSFFVEGDLRAAWLWDDAQVPEEIAATVRAGASVSLRSFGAPDLDARPGEANPMRFDAGFVGIGLQAQYEANSDREEQAVSGGAQLRWVRPGWLIAPSVVLTYDVVKPVRSATRTALAADKESFRRFTARGYWLVPVWRLVLEADAAVFEAYGLESGLTALGWKSGRYLLVGVGIETGWRLSNRFVLHTVSVSYANGQLPSTPDDRQAWRIALDFGSERPGAVEP